MRWTILTLIVGGILMLSLSSAELNATYGSNSNSGNVLTVITPEGFVIQYSIANSQIRWKSRPSQPDAWDTLGGGFSSNSLNTIKSVNGSTTTYKGAYSVADLLYLEGRNEVKEFFVINSLPSIKDYDYLEITGHIYFNKSLDICANNICYTPKGTQDEFNTTGEITLQYLGKIIATMPKPYAVDSIGNTANLTYKVRGSNAQMEYSLLIPTSFLQTAIFPVYADPSITLPPEKIHTFGYEQNITSDRNVTYLTMDNPNIIQYFPFDGDGFSFSPNYKLATSLVVNSQGDMAYVGNAVAIEDGIYGDYIYLDGNGDFLHSSDITPTNNLKNFSFSAWVRTNNSTTIQTIFDRMFDTNLLPMGAQINGWQLEINQSNNLCFYYAYSGSGIAPKLCTSNRFDNNWNFIAIAVNETSIKFNINGNEEVKSLVGSVYNPNGFQAPNAIGGDVYVNGSAGFQMLYRDFFNGSIDEVMHLNKTLSSTEISDIRNNQTHRFLSSGLVTQPMLKISAGNNTMNVSTFFKILSNTNISLSLKGWNIAKGYNDSASYLKSFFHFDTGFNSTVGLNATSVNGAFVSDGYFNNSASFDGINDYLSVPYSSDMVFDWNKDYTWSFWFNTPNINKRQTIISQMNVSNVSGFTIQVGEYTGLYYCVTFAITAPIRTSYAYARNCFIDYGLLQNNTWYHIAVTYNGTNGARLIYVNGQDYSLTSGKPSGSFSLTRNITIGAEYNSSENLINYFNGSIDDLMIFNRTLSQAEVKSLYVNGRLNWSDSSVYYSIDSQIPINESDTIISPTFKLDSSDSFQTPLIKSTQTWEWFTAILNCWTFINNLLEIPHDCGLVDWDELAQEVFA